MSRHPQEGFLSLFLHVPRASGELDLLSQGGHTAGGQGTGFPGVCAQPFSCVTPSWARQVHLPLPPVPFIRNRNGGACFGHVRLDLRAFQTVFLSGKGKRVFIFRRGTGNRKVITTLAKPQIMKEDIWYFSLLNRDLTKHFILSPR